MGTRAITVTGYTAGSKLGTGSEAKLSAATTGVVTADLGAVGTAALSEYINSDDVLQFEAGNAYSMLIDEDAISATELKQLPKLPLQQLELLPLIQLAVR